MTGNDFLQFMTKEFTTFITTPKEKRKKEKQKRKQNRNLHRTEWFGTAPFYLASMLKKRRR